jgi:hypothetical protein
MYKIKKHKFDKSYNEIFCDIKLKEGKDCYFLDIVFDG